MIAWRDDWMLILDKLTGSRSATTGVVRAGEVPHDGRAPLRGSTERIAFLISGTEIGERIYSTRRPEIARAMTSCWISEVPSKIVWLTVPGFSAVDP